jgi:colanic acid biosynthesis glycosyl transferase WcaI
VSDGPRVIFVNRVYWPATAATAQLLTDLAEGLAVKGWPVHVIATGEGLASRNGVTIHRTGPGAHHTGMISRARNYRRFLNDARALVAVLARPGDIVVPMTDPPMLGAAVAREAVGRGAKIIHWIQDVYPEIAAAHFGFLARLATTSLRARRDAAWHDAAACVTLGEDMAVLLTEHGVLPSRVTVVPNWAPRELHALAPDNDVVSQRELWSLHDRFIVAYSGNLGRVHEFATIMDAATRLRDDPKIVFLFIGNGARFDEIAPLARKRKLPNIRLLPPTPRTALPASLRAADAQLVTLLPAYRHLVYPSKLAGVLAAGRPVLFVGPAGSEISRLVQQTACGAAFVPGDAGGLVEGIVRLAKDSALRQAQSTRARALYEEAFTGDAALARWNGLLRRVAGSG